MKENNDFAQEILGKIKKDHIKPKPRWQFLLKNYVVWFFGVLSLIVGSLAFSVIIYLLKNNDWDVYTKVSDSLLEFILLTLPYFWFLFLVLFIAVVYYNIQHTKTGYRYPLYIIVLASVFFSMLGGIIFYKIGFAKTIDNILGDQVSFYPELFNRQVHFWSQVEQGRLGGMVIAINNENEFMLLDLRQQEWIIDKTDAELKFCPKMKGSMENNNCMNDDYHSFNQVIIGRPVNIIGEKCGDFYFCATEIMPAKMGNKFFERKHRDFLEKPPKMDQPF